MSHDDDPPLEFTYDSLDGTARVECSGKSASMKMPASAATQLARLLMEYCVAKKIEIKF